MQGPDAATELQMIELLRGVAAPVALPLLPHLLRARRPGPASAAVGAAPLQLAPPAEPGSPTYSCSDEEGEVPPPGAAPAAADGLAESPLVCAERVARRFRLNQEQAEVLAYVASWQMAPPSTPSSAAKRAAAAMAADRPPPICLVHGPFGSGEGMQARWVAAYASLPPAARCDHSMPDDSTRPDSC